MQGGRGRVVDPNRVRIALTGRATGRLRVKPQVLSSMYPRLAATRYLAHHGRVISDDRAGNSGKALNLWRLIDAPPTDRSTRP